MQKSKTAMQFVCLSVDLYLYWGSVVTFRLCKLVATCWSASQSKANEHQPVEAGKIYHVYRTQTPDVWHISLHWLTISYIGGEMKTNSPHMEHMGYDLWVNHAHNCADMLPGAWRSNEPLGSSAFSILNHLQMSKWLRGLSTILNIYPQEMFHVHQENQLLFQQAWNEIPLLPTRSLQHWFAGA